MDVQTWTYIIVGITFLIYISISIYAGFFLAFPVITYNVLRFMYPAIKKKNFLILFFILISCVLLFLSGAYLSYSLLIPVSLKFLISFNNNFKNARFSFISKGSPPAR